MSGISNNGIIFTQNTLSKAAHSSGLKLQITDTDEFSGQDSAVNYTQTRYTANAVYAYLKPKFDTVYTANTINYTLSAANTATRSIANTLMDVVSVKAFGAIGDGITDDSAAIQNAFQYGANNNKQIYVPSGNYRLASQVVVTIVKRTYSQTPSLYPSIRTTLSILGDGQFNSTFVVDKTNTAGAIKVVIQSNDYNIEIKHIGIGSLLNQYTERTPTNGTAIWIQSQMYPTNYYLGKQNNFIKGPNSTYSVIIDSVFIGPYHNANNPFAFTGSWTRGILLENIFFPTINNCMINGIETAGIGSGYSVGDILTFDNDAYQNNSNYSAFYKSGLNGTDLNFEVLSVTSNGGVTGLTTASSTVGGYAEGQYINIPLKTAVGYSSNGSGAVCTALFRQEVNFLDSNTNYVKHYPRVNGGKGYNIGDILEPDLTAYGYNNSIGMTGKTALRIIVTDVEDQGALAHIGNILDFDVYQIPNYDIKDYISVPLKLVTSNGSSIGSGASCDILSRNTSSSSWNVVQNRVGIYPNPNYVWLKDSTAFVETGINIAAIDLQGCYGPTINLIRTNGYFDYGINHQGVVLGGNAEQGGQLTNSFIVGQRVGFAINHRNLIDPSLPAPGFEISNCHFNAHHYGLYIDNHSCITISNGYFLYGDPTRVNALNLPNDSGYTNYAAWMEIDNPCGLYLGNVTNIVISNCGFYGVGFYSRDDLFSSAINISSKVIGGIILSNINTTVGGVGILNNSRAITIVNGFTTNGARVPLLDATYIPIKDNTGFLTVIGDALPIAADFGQSGASLSERGKDVTFSFVPVFANDYYYAPTKILSANRSDYANNSSSKLGAYCFNGLDNIGNDTRVGYIAADWLNNTSGSANSSLTFSTLSSGTLSSLMILDGTNNRVNIPKNSKLAFSGSASITSSSGVPGTNSDSSISNASKGSIYLNTDGGTANTVWIKENSGNTGWSPLRSAYNNIVTKTPSSSTKTLSGTEDIVLASTAGGSFTLTLPDLNSGADYTKFIHIKNIGAVNNVTISTFNSQQYFNGSVTSLNITPGNSIKISGYSSIVLGTNWYTF